MLNTNNPQINARELLNLYLTQEYDQLSEKFIEILEHFENVIYFDIKNDTQYFINVFIKIFLYLFTQPDYILDDRYTVRFIQLNPTISNLVAMSSFKTTDSYLEILKNQPHNFVKILSLYSARNTVKFDYKEFLDANHEFTCLWYSYFYDLYRCVLANKTSYQNMRDHLSYIDDRLTVFYNISDIYFGATYIDGYRDKEIKQRINQSIKESPFCQAAQIKNTPNPKKIAVVTSLWFSQHSVYRTLAEYIESLKDEYEITLVHLGAIKNNLDIGSFKGIKYIFYKDNYLNIDSVRDNDFMVVYYPDIGMTPESILLSNLRLAPIQICGTGHPVSTFGSEIDYFISGAVIETLEGTEEKYSERLVLLPGLGAIHNVPNYEIRNIPKARSEFIINCSWFAQKINYPMLLLLKQIIKSSKKKILFRFFTGSVEYIKNGATAFAKDIESILDKDNFELIAGKPYDEYMALMEEGDICIESFHFGGSNTVVDSLYLRKLTVTFEGNRWYNRIGSQMLRLVGLEELITNNSKDYTRLILKLIHDDKYRLQLQKKLNQVDLNKTIFSSEGKHYFKQTIDYLIQNHESLNQETSKRPIVII